MTLHRGKKFNIIKSSDFHSFNEVAVININYISNNEF